MEPPPAKLKRGMSTRVIVAPSIAAVRPAIKGAAEPPSPSDGFAAMRQAPPIAVSAAPPLVAPKQLGHVIAAPSWSTPDAGAPPSEPLADGAPPTTYHSPAPPPLVAETVSSANIPASTVALGLGGPSELEAPAGDTKNKPPQFDPVLPTPVIDDSHPTDASTHSVSTHNANIAVAFGKDVQSGLEEDLEGGSQVFAAVVLPAPETASAPRSDALAYFQELLPQGEETYREESHSMAHSAGIDRNQAAREFSYGRESTWEVQSGERTGGEVMDYDPEGQSTTDSSYSVAVHHSTWEDAHLQADPSIALQKERWEHSPVDVDHTAGATAAAEVAMEASEPVTEDASIYNYEHGDSARTSSLPSHYYPPSWSHYPEDNASGHIHNVEGGDRGEYGYAMEDAQRSREEGALQEYAGHSDSAVEIAVVATEGFDYWYPEGVEDQASGGLEGPVSEAYGYDGYEGWTGDCPEQAMEGAETAYYAYPQDETQFAGMEGVEGAGDSYSYPAGTYAEGTEYNASDDDNRGGGEYNPSSAYGGEIYDEFSAQDDANMLQPDNRLSTEPPRGHYHMPIPSQADVPSAEGSPSGTSQSSDQRIVRFSDHRNAHNTSKHLQVWERFFENAFALRQQGGSAASSPLVVSFTSSFARKFFTLAIPAHPAVADLEGDNPTSRAQRSLRAIEEGWRVLLSGSRYQSLLRLAQATQRHTQQDSSKGAAVRALALYASVITGDVSSLKSLLLESSELDLVDERSRGLVHYAAKNNQFHVLALLFDGNIELDQRDTDHNTALHIAAALNRPKVVAFLLNCAADKSLRNNEGLTPSELAYYLGHHEVVQLVQDHEAGVTDGEVERERSTAEDTVTDSLVSSETAAQLPVATHTPTVLSVSRPPPLIPPSRLPPGSLPSGETASRSAVYASLDDSHAQLQSLKHKYRVGNPEETLGPAREQPLAERAGMGEERDKGDGEEGNEDAKEEEEEDDEEAEEEESLSSLLSDRLAEKIWALAHYLISLALVLLFDGPTPKNKKKKKNGIAAIQEPREFSESDSIDSSPAPSHLSRAPPTDSELSSLGFKDPPQDVLLAVAMARANAQRGAEDTNQYSLGGAEGQLPPGTKWRYVPYHPTHGP